MQARLKSDPRFSGLSTSAAATAAATTAATTEAAAARIQTRGSTKIIRQNVS